LALRTFDHNLTAMIKRPSILALTLLVIYLYTSGADKDWPVYLGDNASSQYSSLDQINTSNVDQLTVAWVYHSNDAKPLDRGEIQCNPLIIDGVLYGTSPLSALFALNAATGEELWRQDLTTISGRHSLIKNRGVTYWTDGKEKRLLYGVGGYLFCINPNDGELITDFGNKGYIDLKEGLGRDMSNLDFLANTPGIIYEDLIIIGGRLNEALPAAPGHIRAYDVKTGEIAWRFNTIPHPEEFGYDTWPEDAWQRTGGANVWAGMSVDEARGLVYCPTGSASADFYGGDRIGKNLFANSLICLDARTGKRVWHFQFVHHDLWDRDLPAPPNLLTIRRNGQEIPAVSQTTKSGHVFVFNRVTGEPLFPIEERPYPSSDLAGESAWPTQPLPTKPAPFARQVFSFDIINDLSPDTLPDLQNQFVRIKPHIPFTPPSEQGTIIFPGYDGGGEWGGQAVDPNGILYVNSNEMPWILTMINAAEGDTNGERVYLQMCATCHGIDRSGTQIQGSPVPPVTLAALKEKQLDRQALSEKIQKGAGIMPPFGFLSSNDFNAVLNFLLKNGGGPTSENQNSNNEIVYVHTGYNRWKDAHGYPAVKPPWGTLNAINLNTGDYVWKTTLGEYPELIERGIPPTGTENYGGPIITAGGVLFIGASLDEQFRAFDMKTGKELFRYKLPAGAYSTPATYSVDGRQFIVTASGGGKMGTKNGDAYIAFALPH